MKENMVLVVEVNWNAGTITPLACEEEDKELELREEFASVRHAGIQILMLKAEIL